MDGELFSMLIDGWGADILSVLACRCVMGWGWGGGMQGYEFSDYTAKLTASLEGGEAEEETGVVIDGVRYSFVEGASQLADRRAAACGGGGEHDDNEDEDDDDAVDAPPNLPHALLPPPCRRVGDGRAAPVLRGADARVPRDAERDQHPGGGEVRGERGLRHHLLPPGRGQPTPLAGGACVEMSCES